MRIPILLLSSLLPALAAAELRQPVPDVHALVNVRIVTEPGQVIDDATIVIRDGLIEAVGTHLTVPADARIQTFERGDGQDPITLYPGLIEPYLSIEVEAAGGAEETPPGRHVLINPDRQLRARDWPVDKVQALRRAGFTTALVSANQGLLRGHGLVANLGDGGLSANLIDPAFGQFASFSGLAEGREFPGSLMGAVALLRQSIDDARWQMQARAAWASNPAQPRPEWLEGLDALAPALAGQRPLVFESQGLLDTLRILEFINDPAVRLVLVGHGEEYRRLPAIAERRIRHILPLNFPEAPDARDADDRNVSLEALRHWRNAPDNPRQLQEAGVPLLFTTHGLSQPTQIFANLAKAIERGLDPDRALAALTTEPAAWLGLSDRAGRIRVGQMANFVVVEGELFTDGPSIAEVWVDGRRYLKAALVPPAIDPAGTWSLTLGMGGMGEVPATLVLRGPPTNMEGSLTVMGNETPLNEVRVSGERVIVSIDATRFGGSGTISIRLDIDGDQARGTGSSAMGEFTVRGRKTSGPDGEESI